MAPFSLMDKVGLEKLSRCMAPIFMIKIWELFQELLVIFLISLKILKNILIFNLSYQFVKFIKKLFMI